MCNIPLPITANIPARVARRLEDIFTLLLGSLVAQFRLDGPSGHVRRYLALLVGGRAADDAGIALRGANPLTTVARGVGEAEPPGGDRQVAGRAFAAICNAIGAARTLGADAGTAF